MAFDWDLAVLHTTLSMFGASLEVVLWYVERCQDEFGPQ